MKLTPTTLEGVLILEPRIFRDERGFFLETFNGGELGDTPVGSTFVQANHSRSARGVLRGLHYQLACPQGKLVHVARGSIYDVAVDIRRGSPSFGKWMGLELNDENLMSLWIPPGFAHGFCVLSDFADVIYKCSTLYDPKDDHGIAWNDSAIGIDWPLTDPTISAKDERWEGLDETRVDLPIFE